MTPTSVRRRGVGPVDGVVEAIDGAMLDAHAPNDHLQLTGSRGELRARASVWWSRTPLLNGRRVGFIGHYAAADALAGAELLSRACSKLAAAGCATAVGPADGSTWRPYRFVVESGGEPPFLFEPQHPHMWPQHFVQAGFAPSIGYCSAVADRLAAPRDDGTAPTHIDRLHVRVRPLNPATLDRDLSRIYALSIETFAGNLLYTPIGEAEFRRHHRALMPFVRPDLVLLAERDDLLVGFVLAVPDPHTHPSACRRVIVKTLAVSPSLRRCGIGRALVAEVQRRAAALGFDRAIHALMREANPSIRISRHYARICRRYALFTRDLA